jgi:hypothetical protein
MVETGIAAVCRTKDGWIMRRVIVIAAAGLSLAGCGSLSWDAFKSTPPPMQIQLESTPPGADARTSLGPGCTTPCSVNIPTPEGSDFTVTYTMDKFQPATVPAHVIRGDGSARIDPNPIVAELQRIGPPPKPARKKMHRPRPKPSNGAAAPAAAESPFPNPAPAAAPPPPPAR